MRRVARSGIRALKINMTSRSRAPESLQNRKTVSNKDVKHGRWPEFTLASYNCLHDYYVENDYGHRVEPQFLDAEFRCKRIVEELDSLNADIICLQEIATDFYQDTLRPWLESLGYEGYFLERIYGRTPQIEGLAMFYKKGKFYRSRVEAVQFKTSISDQLKKITPHNGKRYAMEEGAIIQELKLIGTDHVIVVAATHLMFRGFRCPDGQLLQLAHLKKLLRDKYRRGHVILCGDFNLEPHSPLYTFAKSGKLSERQWRSLQESSDINEQEDWFNVMKGMVERTCADDNYFSAYKAILEKEPEVTCVDHAFRCCLDYIFVREPGPKEFDSFTAAEQENNTKDGPVKFGLAPCSILNTMPLPEIEKALPPSNVYPSDHFPLFAKFAVVRRDLIGIH